MKNHEYAISCDFLLIAYYSYMLCNIHNFVGLGFLFQVKTIPTLRKSSANQKGKYFKTSRLFAASFENASYKLGTTQRAM